MFNNANYLEAWRNQARKEAARDGFEAELLDKAKQLEAGWSASGPTDYQQGVWTGIQTALAIFRGDYPR